MKGKRFLAVLLCTALMITGMPFAMASSTDATLLADSYQTAEGRFPWIADWWGSFSTNRLVFDENFQANHDFSAMGIFHQEDIEGYDFGEVKYTANGLEFVQGSTGLGGAWYWRNGLTAWQPLVANKTMIRFRAQLEAGRVLDFQSQVAGATGKIMLKVKSSEACWLGGASDATMTDTYANGVGTGLMDYLVTSDGTNYSLYAKGAAAELWNLVGTSSGFWGSSANNLIEFSGIEGVAVKSVEVLTPEGNKEYTMHEIYPDLPAWQGMESSSNLTFDKNFVTTYDVNGTNPQKIILPSEGITFSDTNGMQMTAALFRWANGYDRWRAMEQRKKPILVRAKVGEGQHLNFQGGYAYHTGGSCYIDVKPDSIYICGGVSTGSRTGTPGVTFKPGTGWVDYLIVSNHETHNYSLYAKRVSDNTDKWTHVATTTEFSRNSPNDFQIYGTGSVKSVDVLTPSASDAAIHTQKAEIAEGMEAAKTASVSYVEHPEYNPTIEKYAHIKAITYDGAEYSDGRKTKVFAYVGFPEGASKDAKVPAVVLIHGGGGHAYLEWVRLWNERGYAAIAMETTGYFPTAPNAGVDEGTENSANNYQYAFGTFAEEGYALAPKCGNPTIYTEVKDQWNYHALTGIILGSNILRQDERVDSSKIGVTGVSWGGTLTAQVIGIDNRYAFAIPVYGTAYLKMHPFENYNNAYVQQLWAAEQNLDNATMPIMWYVWNDDGAFGVPGCMESYKHTAPLNDKTMVFMRDSWGHSHGNVFNQNATENHSKIFADWAINDQGGYPTFTEQPEGREFNAKIDIPEDVTGEIKATLYYIEEPMTYSKHNKFGYSTQNYLDQWWKKTTDNITVDREAGTVSGTIPTTAAGYYINLEFTVDGVDCESTSLYVAPPEYEGEPEPEPEPDPEEQEDQFTMHEIYPDLLAGQDMEPTSGFEIKSTFMTDLDVAGENKQKITIVEGKGVSFSDENGLSMDGESAIRWAHGYDRWRAMEQRKKPVRVRAKVGEGQRLNFQGGYAYNIGGSCYIDVYPEGVYICGGVSTNSRVPTPDVTFKPGTGWVDYLIVSNHETHNYSLYAKRDEDNTNKWTHVATTTEFSKNSLNYFQVYGSGNVKSIHVLNPATSQSAIQDQKAEIATGMETAKNTAVSYVEHPDYAPTIAKYSHIKAITYDGAEYSDGRKTKVFAYVGFPEEASKDAKVPAVVLIHGGGGHAYLEWVRLWNERGYAAIAMETTGYFPSAPNAGVDEGTENSANNYQYDFGDFAEEGYALAPKCGNPTVYTPVKDQWNYHALIGIIKAGNILRQDERVDSSKMGVTGVSWGGTLTSQVIGIDNRFAFAIPIYGTAYLKLHPFENYNTEYVQQLWAAEQNLDNANMAIMWYVWNDDGAFGIPGYMASYNHTAPLNDKTLVFMRDSWGHSHGSVFSQNKTENHSKIFADWVINKRGGYPTFTEQPEGRNFNAKIDIPEDVTGEIKATLYYIEEPMTYSKHNKFGYSTQNYLDQWWKKTTKGITVDRATGTVSGTIPESAAGYYINLEFTVDGVDCESTSLYVAAPQLKVSNINADPNLSFTVECIQAGENAGSLYAALYNRNNVLIAIKKLDAVEKQTVTFTETGYDKIKVFWWDENQKSITEEIEA